MQKNSEADHPIYFAKIRKSSANQQVLTNVASLVVIEMSKNVFC